MPPGVWGLDVVFSPPRARFTCRCGYDVREARADLVATFVAEVATSHRAVCELTKGQGRDDGRAGKGNGP